MSSKAKKTTVLYIVLLLLVLCFIWGQSCIGAQGSTRESTFVTEQIIQPAVDALAGGTAAGVFTEKLVRKLAHVAEYTVLGFVLGLLLRNKRPRFWPALLLGLAAAFLDETVQLFTGRNGLITDVWIDLIGVAVGAAVSLLFRSKRATAGKAHAQDGAYEDDAEEMTAAASE